MWHAAVKWPELAHNLNCGADTCILNQPCNRIMKFRITGLALLSSAYVKPSHAQPIIYAGYDPHQNGYYHDGVQKPLDCRNYHYYRDYDEDTKTWVSGYICTFSKALASDPASVWPSLPEYLAMFSDRYVENNGKIYAAKNSQGNGAMTFEKDMPGGLYEVLPETEWPHLMCRHSHACIFFKKLLYAENIGQIVAAPPKYAPFEVIGVDQVTKKIYGYYPDINGEWKRKATVWGDAKNGSMRSNDDGVIGLSSNDRVGVISQCYID